MACQSQQRRGWLAKAGALMHRQPTQLQTALYEQQIADLRIIAKLLVTLWPLWPIGDKYNRSQKAPARPTPLRGHLWYQTRQHTWKCQTCSLSANTYPGKYGGGPCTRQARRHRPGEIGPGHRLASARCGPSGTRLQICTRCGHWAATKPRGLLKPCPGAPNQQGAKVLRRLRRQRHPTRPAALSEVVLRP